MAIEIVSFPGRKWWFSIATFNYQRVGSVPVCRDTYMCPFAALHGSAMWNGAENNRRTADGRDHVSVVVLNGRRWWKTSWKAGQSCHLVLLADSLAAILPTYVYIHMFAIVCPCLHIVYNDMPVHGSNLGVLESNMFQLFEFSIFVGWWS